MIQEKQTILWNKEIAPDIFELTLQGEMVDAMVPGQFVHIQVPREDLLLRRPISIATIDAKTGSYRVLIRVDGEGTQSICAQHAGMTLDVLGPLGNGFDISFLNPKDRVLIVGGGIGVPPLLGLANLLHEKDIDMDIVLGFQTRGAIVYEEEFKRLGHVTITTDNGSYGIHGYVSTVIDTLTQPYQAIYACGPKGLNRYINLKFEDHPHAYISLEERMGCGIGACAACVCQKRKDPRENIKICQHGPVFKTGEVIV